MLNSLVRTTRRFLCPNTSSLLLFYWMCTPTLQLAHYVQGQINGATRQPHQYPDPQEHIYNRGPSRPQPNTSLPFCSPLLTQHSKPVTMTPGCVLSTSQLCTDGLVLYYGIDRPMWMGDTRKRELTAISAAFKDSKHIACLLARQCSPAEWYEDKDNHEWRHSPSPSMMAN